VGSGECHRINDSIVSQVLWLSNGYTEPPNKEMRQPNIIWAVAIKPKMDMVLTTSLWPLIGYANPPNKDNPSGYSRWDVVIIVAMRVFPRTLTWPWNTSNGRQNLEWWKPMSCLAYVTRVGKAFRPLAQEEEMFVYFLLKRMHE